MTLMLSRKVLPKTLTPEQVFSVIRRSDSAVFWLDSGVEAVTEGARSYLGFTDEVRVAEAGSEHLFLNELRAGLSRAGAANPSIGPAFALGWVGWFSYEFGQALMGLTPTYDPEIPPAVMLRARAAVEFDHSTGVLSVIGEDDAVVDVWLQTFAALQAQHRDAPEPSASGTPVWRTSCDEYRDRIEDCREAIRAGDAYLLCLTSQVTVETDEDPAEVYVRLRRHSPAHHGGYISAAGIQLVSASPEQFLSVRSDGGAQTKPIKGTRPRGRTPEHDLDLRAELTNDHKELAENLMIVDLMRNDFAAVCETGSVQVPGLHEVETYAHVHQLVSTVSGQLHEGRDVLDLIAHSFPAGSMTGTPKRSAIEILRRLEGAPRGLYSGCFGYLSNDGCADLAMVIRSIVFAGGRASIGSGGGITAHSQADAELAEVQLKAAALLAALKPVV